MKEHLIGDNLNAAVIPDFCQKYLNLDMSGLWNDIETMEHYQNDSDLQQVFEQDDGWNTKLLPGAHPALNYRGKAIARTKFWLQTDFDKGMRRYGYTGWQWRASYAQFDDSLRIQTIATIPVTTDVSELIALESHAKEECKREDEEEEVSEDDDESDAEEKSEAEEIERRWRKKCKSKSESEEEEC